MKTTMAAMRATDGKCEHVCADLVLTGDAQMSADLNCTNNWEVLGELSEIKNIYILSAKVKITTFM